ncbi:MAG TPA: phosphotransferase [Tenericutes bacterium]|nr:phosphotransferase [Mycoplasmatota bacterium]
MNENLKNIISQFKISGKIISIEAHGNGIINNTFVVTCEINNKMYEKYLFQKINTNAFKDPFRLMRNIEKVTNFIENKIKSSKRPFLRVILTKNNTCLYEHCDDFGNKEYYRAYNFIEDSSVYNKSTDPIIIYNAAKAFGNFQKMLIDYPIEDIEETIPNFHNTKERYKNFIKDIECDIKKRVSTITKEIEVIIKNQDKCNLLVDLLDKNILKERVIHNDTKINNVLMNKNTNDFLTVIDLDTVMLGTPLYDYGDGVRSACSAVIKNDQNPNSITIDMELFKYYTDGYLSEMANYLSQVEINYLADSILIMTLELAIRFLNDYINGDTYFKIDYPDHNLVRARNQLNLFKEIESKLPLMREYITETINK